MNTTTQTKRPAYTVGQAVEVLACDFNTPGFPRVWQRGQVTSVKPLESGRWDVMVVTEGGALHPQIVGTRGGGKNLRAA